MKKMRLLIMVLLVTNTFGLALTTTPAEAVPSVTIFGRLQWWPVVLGSGPIIHHARVIIPADSHGTTSTDFAAGLRGVCQLRGDFEIQVDYDLQVWPFANGVRTALSFSSPPELQPGVLVIRMSASATGDFLPAGEYYVFAVVGSSGFLQPPVSIPTSDLSGKLKMVRMGGTMTGYYFSGSSWVSIASATVTADDLFISLVGQSGDRFFADQDVKLSFKNFILSSGQLNCL